MADWVHPVVITTRFTEVFMTPFVEIVAGFVIVSLGSVGAIIVISLFNNLLSKSAYKNDAKDDVRGT
jgi:hypothetical protein